MRLTSVRITNYKNIVDSGEFAVDDVTCLVGKNQSGKSAILQALYRVNPSNQELFALDFNLDYPKPLHSAGTTQDGSTGSESEVVAATFSLEDEDIAALRDIGGVNGLKVEFHEVIAYVGYNKELTFGQFDVDEQRFIGDLIDSIELLDETRRMAKRATSVDALLRIIEELETTESDEELLEDYRVIKSAIEQVPNRQSIVDKIQSALRSQLPRFIFVKNLAYIKTDIDLQQLIDRRNSNQLVQSDLPLLGLLVLGDLVLDDLVDLSQNEEARTSQLEAAQLRIEQRITDYWKVGRDFHVQLKPWTPLDGSGRPMLSVRIQDREQEKNAAFTTQITQRSDGFQWFFSFAALLEYVRSEESRTVILMDEPGTSLHGSAQSELLRFIRAGAGPHGQVIYTTHSPFMIDPDRLNEVRVVEYGDSTLGAVVRSEVDTVTRESLLPLQAAMGYSLLTPLLIGANTLLVEGASDKLYIEKMNSVLTDSGRVSLDPRWSVVPVGGIGKIATVASFFQSREQLNVAVLCDGSFERTPSMNDEKGLGILKKSQMVFVADSLDRKRADIEGMFDPDTFLKLVNCTYDVSLELADLKTGPDRILERLSGNPALSSAKPTSAEFHFKCAETFATKFDTVLDQLTDTELERWTNLFATINKMVK